MTEQELSDLTVVEAKDRADMEKIILEGVDPKSAEYARGQRLINKLRSGKVNGAIHNGKYIVFDKRCCASKLRRWYTSSRYDDFSRNWPLRR